jgi:glucosamine-6-phosphate isomerase
MKLIISDTYDTMSGSTAEALLQILQTLPRPLICTASGASPAGLYRELVRLIAANKIDTSHWSFVGLDEWKGLNGSDEGSSRHQVNEQLFHPLGLAAHQVCFFDGRADHPEGECERVEAFIKQHGGIDVAIIGIGINGHIAMNEPGTDPSLRSHVAAIHASTQEAGQKYFKTLTSLDTGLTVGLATLLDARHLLLLASGEGKAESIYQMLSEPISAAFPATLIREHPHLQIFLDEAAAKRLPPAARIPAQA